MAGRREQGLGAGLSERHMTSGIAHFIRGEISLTININS